MISDSNRTQVLEVVAAKASPEKAEEKRKNTWQGAALVFVGALLGLGSFIITIRLIAGGVEITNAVVVIALAPLAACACLIGWGATRWSGEYVGAFMKDMRDTFLPFLRRGGS